MLSYRHGFHAGNHADVLKHLVYQFILQYMGKKSKPFNVIDTHAGAGAYKLSEDFAQKNKEFDTGIGPLWDLDRQSMPASVRNYVESVDRFNRDSDCSELQVYPGSPWFALDNLPLEGKAFFHELHPTDFDLLRQFVRTNRYRKAINDDGFVASMGLYPPASKRSVTIIDPPYELKEDYERVVDYTKAVNKRFSSGVIAIWYPVVDRYRIEKMEKQLQDSGIRNIQLFEFSVTEDSEQKGMSGSGMIVVNPPWTLNQEMTEVLPYLRQQLAPSTGHFRQVQLVDE